MLGQNEIERLLAIGEEQRKELIGDGVGLMSTAHPVGEPVVEDPDISDAIEMMEIEVSDDIVLGFPDDNDGAFEDGSSARL